MTEKVKKFPHKSAKKPKKKIIEKLRLKYPRIERNSKELETIPREEEKYYPAEREGLKRLRLSNTLADQGYIEWGRTDFNRLFGPYLEQVIYRGLKAVYGPPDILAFDVLKEDTLENGSPHITGWPIDWGYLMQSVNGNCFEILKRSRRMHPETIFWLNLEEKPEKLPEPMIKSFSEFIVLFYQLIEILDSDYSIKVEKQKVDKLFRGAAPRCVINIYYQNFQAGIDLLELSEEWVADIDQSLLDLHSQAQWTEASNIHRKGSILYVSAIVFFLMALEGFINLLYKFLLKPQFRGKEYERAIWKTDLEMRILHLPIYCNGFSSDDINPDDVSYKQWLKLRPFRNNLLHANITEENEFIITVEDHFLFQYNPLFQLTKQKSKKTHTQQLYIRKKDVVQVKQSVEKFASAIIGKMDETEKRWVMSWIDCLEIWFEGNEEKAFIRPVRIPGISSS